MTHDVNIPHFQHNLNRLFKNCIKILILDKFFLKYEGGRELDPPEEKLNLIRVKNVYTLQP